MKRREEIIETLERGLERSIGFFTTLTPDQLASKIYQDGARWTAQQVVAHFITIERSMHWLFENILSGGEGSPENFDVDRYNRSQTRKLDNVPLIKLLDQLTQVRRKTIDMVAAMAESDLDREGRHAFHGHGRLERFIRWADEHALIHEDDIRSALKLKSKGEGA
jgi:hypothetical protein